MIQNVSSLVDSFRSEAAHAGFAPVTLRIEHELQRAPHTPHRFPEGQCAVYVFSISPAHGEGCPAGADRALKVGKVGGNSNARFQSQHYNPKSSGSNLAATLLAGRTRWSYLGIADLREEDAGTWIRTNLDRDNFYLDPSQPQVLGELERYLRSMLSPVFEGG